MLGLGAVSPAGFGYCLFTFGLGKPHGRKAKPMWTRAERLGPGARDSTRPDFGFSWNEVPLIQPEMVHVGRGLLCVPMYSNMR